MIWWKNWINALKRSLKWIKEFKLRHKAWPIKFLTISLYAKAHALQKKLTNFSWRHRKEALGTLFTRYRDVFRFWWKQRNEFKMPELKVHEAEFLPAILALQNQPVSPVGRLVAKILLTLISISLAWSILGKMDIIVVGQGKIIPGGRTKTIASVEVAKVAGLYVEEGQAVKKGQLLIALDSQGPQSEVNKAEGDRQLALLQIERSKALLEALLNNTTPKLAPIEGIERHFFQQEVLHLQAIWRDYVDKRDRILSQIKRYGDALPMAIQRAHDYQVLAKDRDVSVHSYYEKEQERIELQGKLEDAKTQLKALKAETAKTAQDDLYQSTRIWSGAVQDIHKAQAHTQQLNLVSPVDGVVQQLSVHTVGGVVPPAQPLMLIVPNQYNVEFEAYIENKDIGFIQEGQSAQVKLDAYDYSRFGTIGAIVSHVSRDAVDFSGNGPVNTEVDSKKDSSSGAKGLLYAVKVRLQRSTLVIDGKEMPIKPGMSGGVEIRTGERRIISYLLSPLITHAHESLIER